MGKCCFLPVENLDLVSYRLRTKIVKDDETKLLIN